MTRIAILGGGISGLTAAYELEKARRAGADVDWQLFERSDRLGGIVETTRLDTPEGQYILEGGPDGWVSEKPWARELAIELGLEDQLISSNDATRKTYILHEGELQAIPDGLRMMVPTDLAALDASPLFSATAKAAYAAEPGRADELKASAPASDESVASFVQRHFGTEVMETIAAPLLSGIFGGDAHKLSVRSVMPAFVAMEREHGSLILALQAKKRDTTRAPQPIFTSLRNGMGSLVDALVTQLPEKRIKILTHAQIHGDGGWFYDLVGSPEQKFLWTASYRTSLGKDILEAFDHIILATPLDVTRAIDCGLTKELDRLLPTEASSAVLAAFTWPADLASTFTIPPGFGFLVPPTTTEGAGGFSTLNTVSKKEGALAPGFSLLAATFVDQKFPHRAPTGARILRAFFGGPAATALQNSPDEIVAAAALTQLRTLLGPMPDPTHTVIKRWPRSLPQYEVGHLDRMDELEKQVEEVPGLHLLGNSYRGVGLPDLIHSARVTVERLLTGL
jgi:oxygen-dependent protoporphyrinogen oxidase